MYILHMYIKFFRILLYGIIRTIRPQGPLDGLLGGRFILAFLSVLCLMGAKGVFIAFVVMGYREPRIILSLSAILMIGLQFLPQLILAIFTSIGFSWNSIKLIPYHPETLLLPSGTVPVWIKGLVTRYRTCAPDG